MIMKPAEMAAVYWSRLKGMSIFEVEEKLRHNKANPEYWREVLEILFDKKQKVKR